MIFTLKWLKDFLETDQDVLSIANNLTNLGLEVESVIDRREELSQFIIGEIIHVSPHPNANKLQICKVDIGNKNEINVICGAKNARKGIKVVFAPCGSKIPESSIIIQNTQIRGVESSGMLCSYQELNILVQTDTNNYSGIIEMPSESVVGSNLINYFDLDDVIFDISITPNRGDCLSVYGIARDLAAKDVGLLKPINHPPMTMKESDNIKITILEPNIVPLFSTWNISGIEQTKTPEWIVSRLFKVGIKSINVVVDVLNYVSHSFGQPMHAYDSDTISSELQVGHSMESTFIALDEKEYKLTNKDLVVTSCNKVAALVGIIGSNETKVTNSTTNILIESAIVNNEKIATTGRNLKINTQARYKFERHVDPNACLLSAQIAVDMISTICKGKFIGAQIIDNRTKNVYGFVTSTGNLLLYDDEVKFLRKIFEKLYANYLLFYAKVYEANITQKVLDFEI